MGIDASSCRVEPHGHVSLCWNADEAIFPQAKKFAMSATPIAAEERDRALDTVIAALKCYPAPLLQNNLKAVFLVGVLRFRGVVASGTYGADRVYLGDQGTKLGYSKAWITRTFHCEFSSILLWRHPDLFDTAAWKACNSPDFSYGIDGVGAIKNGTASTAYSSEWWQQGFLSKYSTASVEEDFNSIVGYLFDTTPDNRPALDASETLQKKAALVEKFYRRLGMDINAPDGLPLAEKPLPAKTDIP